MVITHTNTLNQKSQKQSYWLHLANRGILDLSQFCIQSLTPELKMHRCFVGGSLEKGGRFYHQLQGLPKEVRRQYLLIDGQPACELDYRATFPALLYAREGVELTRDPYVIKGWDRDLIK